MDGPEGAAETGAARAHHGSSILLRSRPARQGCDVRDNRSKCARSPLSCLKPTQGVNEHAKWMASGRRHPAGIATEPPQPVGTSGDSALFLLQHVCRRPRHRRRPARGAAKRRPCRSALHVLTTTTPGLRAKARASMRWRAWPRVPEHGAQDVAASGPVSVNGVASWARSQRSEGGPYENVHAEPHGDTR